MTNTNSAATLAAIIREVDGAHSLGAAALAEAILAHPASQCEPALPVPTDADLEAESRDENPYCTALPEISDSLIQWLILEVLDASATATKLACWGRPYNPIPHVRARLLDVLRAAS